MKHKDTIAAIFILIICAIFWVQTKDFSKYGALFPQTILYILGFLALILLVRSLIIHEKKKGILLWRKVYTQLVIMVVFTIAWAFFINIFGFLTTSIIFFTAIYSFLAKKGTPPLQLLLKLAIVITTVVLFYLSFSKLLLVPFPRGFLL